MNALGNEHLARTIQAGGAAVGKSSGMVAFGSVLSHQDVLDLIAFIRTLAAPPYVCP
jgi:hypothetical protein